MSRHSPPSGIPKLALPVQKKARAQTNASIGSPGRQKGSFIQVIARVRPRLPCELLETESVEVLTDCKTILLGDGSNRKQYALDRVFDSRSPEGAQIRVFGEFARNLVLESLKGYNVCIFAYGHTGSGKTYTMLGDGGFAPDVTGSEAGILPRFLHAVFHAHSEDNLADKSSSGYGYTCEFYEVYNEQINDLIAAEKMGQTKSPRKNTSGREGLRVHVHPKHGVRIENLTCSVVASAEEALGLVNFGNQMRTVAATTMNERSSRSHAIFTFRFEPLDVPPSPHAAKDSDGPQCQSTVTFVDLAGKEEKLASNNRAMQFREMCYINTSLFHLAHLITKLSDGNVDRGSLSDFRNSKLTLLLSHALMGNSRTALVATLAPLKSYIEDTVSTMNFAQSVKKIKTRPTVNNKTQKLVISELEAEVRMLQKELNTTKTNNFDKEQELLTAQALINHYKTSWEEAVARSEVAKSGRQSVILKANMLDSQALPVSSNGRIVPFLTKLCDDPSLQGCCNFFLGQGDLIIGKNAQICDMVLQGVGITEEMCRIMCSDDGSVKVEICDDEDDVVPRVLVRGTGLSPDANPEVTMEHSDCIIFGFAHAFRLVAPTPEQLQDNHCMDARDLVRSTIEDLDLASALEEIVDETGTEFKEVYPYIQNLSTKLPEAHLQTLLQSLHCMCPLIDEANVITEEIWRGESIRFELRALTNIFDIENDMPTLVVCVLKLLGHGEGFSKPRTPRHSFSMSLDQTIPMSPASTRRRHDRQSMAHALGLSQNMRMGGCDMLSYVWPMEKFLWRLGEIRDIYQEGSQAEDNFMAVRRRLASKPSLNPWREVSIDDVKLLEEPGCRSEQGAEEKNSNDVPKSNPEEFNNSGKSDRSNTRASVVSGTSWFSPPPKKYSNDMPEIGASPRRRSSISLATVSDIQQVISNFGETEGTPSHNLSQFGCSSQPLEPSRAAAFPESTRSSVGESLSSIEVQEQSPEEVSLKRAAAWLEKPRSNESPRGSLYTCPELKLPSVVKREIGPPNTDTESDRLRIESDISSAKPEDDPLLRDTPSAKPEDDPLLRSENLSSDDPLGSRKCADDDQPIRIISFNSMDRMDETRYRCSSFSGGSAADSPRVLASVNQMKFKIDSFYNELQKRDNQVAQLTEERDRAAAAFETLLQRINDHVGRDSPGASSESNEMITSLNTEMAEADDQNLSCKKVNFESSGCEKQGLENASCEIDQIENLSCKKEDFEKMVNLLENLRKDVDRLHLSTPRVAWQPPMMPVMHAPINSPHSVPGSPRGFAWQSPGATPVGSLTTRVVSAVPVGVVTGPPTWAIDGSRPSSPRDTSVRALASASSHTDKNRSRSPSPSQGSFIPQTGASTLFQCNPNSTHSSPSPPPTRLSGPSRKGGQNMSSIVDCLASPQSPPSRRTVPARRVVSPPNRQVECLTSASHVTSSPSSPRCPVGTPRKTCGNLQQPSSQILRRGSPGPSRQCGSLTLRIGEAPPRQCGSLSLRAGDAPSRQCGSLTLRIGEASPNSNVAIVDTPSAMSPGVSSRPQSASTEMGLGDNTPRYAPRSSSSTASSGPVGSMNNLAVSSRPSSSIAGSRARTPVLVSNLSQGFSVLRGMNSLQAPVLRAGSPPHIARSPTRELGPLPYSSRSPTQVTPTRGTTVPHQNGDVRKYAQEKSRSRR